MNYENDVIPESMPQKGRFGHSAVGIHGNIMVIIGGFSGYPHGDVIAYKFPGVVAPPNVSNSGHGIFKVQLSPRMILHF